MADTLRIRSGLPLGMTVSEPHPDPEKPGNSPQLKSFVLKPGVNELSGDDVATYHAWAAANGAGFIASPDAVKAGTTDGMIFEMTEDEPAQEFGFQPALDRAAAAMSADDAQSTITDPGPIPGAAMKNDAPPAQTPVITSATPLKTPAVTDATPAPVVKAPAAVVAPAAK